jgi:phosphoribosylamine--glycine ligase/phosphoribosylformylglycinamidine cyclo-ligase
MEEEKLRILLIGSGGREHALAWKLSQSPLVDSVKVAPGNGGTATGISKVQNVSNVDPNDFRSLLAFAKEHGVNLVVPGPEVPLVAGIESVFRAGEHGYFCLCLTSANASKVGFDASDPRRRPHA